jgi:hypothetical protein
MSAGTAALKTERRIELLAVRSSTTMMRSMWLPFTTTVTHWP